MKGDRILQSVALRLDVQKISLMLFFQQSCFLCECITL